jgi:hypothetical protein
MKIENINKYGKKAKGRNELIDYLKGKRLSMRKALLSKCYECMNAYADGKVDCNIPNCPLYPYMPYRKGDKLVLRKMSAEQKEKTSYNIRKKKHSNTPVVQYYA